MACRVIIVLARPPLTPVSGLVLSGSPTLTRASTQLYMFLLGELAPPESVRKYDFGPETGLLHEAEQFTHGTQHLEKGSEPRCSRSKGNNMAVWFAVMGKLPRK